MPTDPPKDGWRCEMCAAVFATTSGMRRHAVGAHRCYFRTVKTRGVLVPIPAADLAEALAKHALGAARVADRPRLLAEFKARENSAPVGPAATVRRIATTSSTPPATVVSAGAESVDAEDLDDLDLGLDAEALDALIPEPPPASAAAPAATVESGASPAHSDISDVSEARPPLLPPGLSLVDIASFIVEHPDLSAWDISNVLLGRVKWPPVTPDQYDRIKLLVAGIVTAEQLQFQVAGRVQAESLAAGADPDTAQAAAIDRVFQASRRPR